jgi:hypothetical protein
MMVRQVLPRDTFAGRWPRDPLVYQIASSALAKLR